MVSALRRYNFTYLHYESSLHDLSRCLGITTATTTNSDDDANERDSPEVVGVFVPLVLVGPQPDGVAALHGVLVGVGHAARQAAQAATVRVGEAAREAAVRGRRGRLQLALVGLTLRDAQRQAQQQQRRQRQAAGRQPERHLAGRPGDAQGAPVSSHAARRLRETQTQLSLDSVDYR